MSTHTKSDAIYVAGDSAHERKRLQDQANILNPFTRRLFENAGITAGMRVLDVGSGVGDVAFLLAEMVGPEGSVVGVDSNPAILETAREQALVNGYANVSFISGDIRQIELGEEFDAVVGRVVLMYLKDPIEAIRQATRYLRSGGIIAFLEPDLTNEGVTIPSIPLMGKVNDWVLETFKRAGIEMHMGLKLRQTFIAAGLEEPQMHADSFVGGGKSWFGYKYVEDMLRSMLPAMEKLGVTTAADVEIDTFADRLRDEFVAQNCTGMTSPWISAWSRKA